MQEEFVPIGEMMAVAGVEASKFKARCCSLAVIYTVIISICLSLK